MFPALLLPRASDEREASSTASDSRNTAASRDRQARPSTLLGEVLWSIYGPYWWGWGLLRWLP